jgi:hypothetical protein
MNISEKIKVRLYRFERYGWALAVGWTIVIITLLVWNIVYTKQDILESARIEARTAYNKDIIYRRWNAGHGGVYVPVTEETQPNPYLSHIPERDIKTPLGKLLTLMNPAYMTRQVHELLKKERGVLGHITSLNPIRSKNAPDPWETKALKAFEHGEKEISSIEKIEGKEYMRLMRPLITEKSCLKCHAVQGYKVGDIRGGISVSIPIEPLWVILHMRIYTLSLGHILLWLIGLFGIVFGTHRLRGAELKQRQSEEELNEYRYQLEEIVGTRTAELNTANEQLQKKIRERKQMEEELKKRIKDLEEFYNMAVGREIRMIELKEEIESLKKELGKYKNP